MALKVGAEDRTKVALAAALGVAVLVLAARAIFGGPDAPPPAPSASSAVPVARPAAHARPSVAPAPFAGASPTHTAGPADAALHPELMAENESYLYRGAGRNIFSLAEAPPAPVKIEPVKAPIRPSIPVAVAPSGPPPPPAIDLRFFGYSARKDGTRRAFLLHGEDVFIASEGEVVSHRYRIVKIAATSVQVEDLPYHNTQSLPLVLN